MRFAFCGPKAAARKSFLAFSKHGPSLDETCTSQHWQAPCRIVFFGIRLNLSAANSICFFQRPRRPWNHVLWHKQTHMIQTQPKMSITNHCRKTVGNQGLSNPRQSYSGKRLKPQSSRGHPDMSKRRWTTTAFLELPWIKKRCQRTKTLHVDHGDLNSNFGALESKVDMGRW